MTRLPEEVDALRMAVDGAQLGAIVLGEHRELDAAWWGGGARGGG